MDKGKMLSKPGDKTIRIVTPKFRASFVHVFKPHSGFENQEPKYSIQMLFDPKEVDLSLMKAAVNEARKAKWGPDKTKWPKLRHPVFKDGNEKNLEAYQGKIIVEARSKMKPGVVDVDGVTEIVEPSEFFSGCYARASVSVFCWEHKAGGKGVSFGLQNVKKIKDGPALSGKSNAKDDFGDIEELASDGSEESGEDFDDSEETVANENDF